MKKDLHKIAIELLAKAKLMEAEKLKNPKNKQIAKLKPRKPQFKPDTTDYSGMDYRERERAIRRKLISNATEAEKEFYLLLDILEIPYEKQYPIHSAGKLYFADAYFKKQNIVVELDGGYHKREDIQISDKIRTKNINKAGIKVLRYYNDEVYNRAEFLDNLNKRGKFGLKAYQFI